MAGDLEGKPGTAAPDPKQIYFTDENSSGANTPPDKELTEQEITALKARLVNENEEKQEELKKDKGPTIPGATLWMRSDNEWLDQVATQPSIYDDPRLGKYFAPHPKYENLHRFDPAERWTWREEMVCHEITHTCCKIRTRPCAHTQQENSQPNRLKDHDLGMHCLLWS